jgi:Transposase Tn5 dimerisation domain
VGDPTGSIPQSGDDWSDIKMTYDFYNNEKVKESAIAGCIHQATASRCRQAEIVLNIMDTTSVNFSSSAEGLGYLEHGMGNGLMVHNSLAVDQQGCALGILHQKIWARDKAEIGKKKFRAFKDIDEKESYRWIESMSQSDKLLNDVPLRVHIGDRESDIYDLLATTRPAGSELLIRASHNRKTILGNSMWEEVEQQPPLTCFELGIPKTTTEGSRKVTMEIRASMIVIGPPQKKSELSALIVHGIIVRQADKKINGLQWRLISTMPVNTAEQAMKYVRWYSYRWRVERFHYILKSGCRLEDLQLRNVKALQKAVIVYSLCAFKIMQMLYLSRKDPELPCRAYLTDTEWQVLNHIHSKSPIVTQRCPSLSQCVIMLAKLGGYIGRNNDGPPGIKNLWRGLQQLNTVLKVINKQDQWLSTN